MDILEVQHITKQYASHKALDDVSLEVPAQSIFGLLGPNGAGKTSLIRIVNQITAPDQGNILFEGKKLQPKHIEEIGYMPEERGLYKKMQAGEQALYLARLKGLSRHDAMTKLKFWFEKFEIQGWWNKKIEELSKGMQQKIQFIVTILHEPKLLILDEPFTGFDPINANIIKNELLSLKEKGSTIVLSTHRMESVEEMCTHIALINKSKLIMEGSVKDVRRRHKTDMFEVDYTGSPVAFSTALWTGFELIENVDHEDHHIARVRALGTATNNDLLGALIQQVNVHTFREILPTMNDIFISHVKGDRSIENQTQSSEN